MSATHPYQQLSSNQIRHLLLGPYDYERKLEGRRVDEREPRSFRPPLGRSTRGAARPIDG